MLLLVLDEGSQASSPQVRNSSEEHGETEDFQHAEHIQCNQCTVAIDRILSYKLQGASEESDYREVHSKKERNDRKGNKKSSRSDSIYEHYCNDGTPPTS